MLSNKLILIISVLLLWSEAESLAQTKNGLSYEFSLGGESGWWIEDLGSDDPGIENNLGYNRSHSAIILSFQNALLYTHKKWTVGFVFSHNRFPEQTLRRPRDSQNINSRILISKEGSSSVVFNEYLAHLEYAIYNGRRLSVSPYVRYGGFSIQTQHPDLENFEQKRSLEVGLNAAISVKRFTFLFGPKFSEMRIQLSESDAFNREHTIYGVGGSLSVRYRIL